MRTIHKFQIPASEFPTITMPVGAEVLSAKSQRGNDITLWALVETNAEMAKRTFVVVGTGHPMPCIERDRLRFIDTVLLAEGALVFHVFEFFR